MDGQGTTWRRNIAENFNRLSRVHQRYRQTTDRQTTDRQTDRRWQIANMNLSSRSLKTDNKILLKMSARRQRNSPVMECTVSKATIFGAKTSALASSCSRCRGSLWRNTCFGTPLWQIPWIIDAWFPESENISHSLMHTTNTVRYSGEAVLH